MEYNGANENRREKLMDKMPEVRSVGSDGRVTIPKKFRDMLDIKARNSIMFEIKTIDGETYLTLSKKTTLDYLMEMREEKMDDKDKKELKQIFEKEKKRIAEEFFPENEKEN